MTFVRDPLVHFFLFGCVILGKRCFDPTFLMVA